MSTVWLVDDSDLERSVVRRALEKNRRIVEFCDGSSVLERIGAGELPDVIVLDCNLPDVSGIEVTLHLRERYAQSQLPILMMSGTMSASEDVVAGLRAGANDYVTKPYSELELVARVETLAQAKRQRDRADSAERALRDLIEHLPDPFFAIDRDGRITFANRAAARVLGREWSTFLTKQVSGIIPGLQLPASGPEPDAPPSDHVRDVTIGDRVYAPAYGRLTLGEQAGESMTITLRDVTEKVRAIDRRDRFLAMLAHELRNPLAPIVSASEGLALDAGPDRRKWEIVHRQAVRLTRLVDDLLDVSRISRGRIEIRLETVEMGATLDRAIESCQPILAARQHTMLRAESPPAWVHADPIRLEQMLTNLINNAAKYTDPGGIISLGVRVEDGHVVVSISDNGIGISPVMLEAVFDMFVQVDESLNRAQGGLGIGLLLVRQLAEMQGGTVRARSEGPGKGSEFVLEMPAAEAPGDAQNATARMKAIKPRPLRVLLVDDNEDALELLAQVVGRGGHDVRTAADGAAALELAREMAPDVVFLDIGLPGIDGYEVAKRMRDELGLDNALLVALSGYSGADFVERARKAGFDQHLVKPVGMQAVDDVLRSHVRP